MFMVYTYTCLIAYLFESCISICQMRIKEREFDGELSKTKLKFGDEQRYA